MKSQLNYKISGAANAPVITLAHGLATDLSMWDAVVPQLESRYRVLRYDARGHGQSPAPSDSYTLSELAQDVVDLLDDLSIEKTNFVGLSMGGMVGMGLGLHHAERIEKLVICDARGDAPDAYRKSWSDRIERVTADGVGVLAGPTVDRWFTEQFKRNDESVNRMRAMVSATSADGYVGCARALQDLDYARHLPTMTVPTLFLVGSEDVGAPPGTMRQLHHATPGSQFVEIENAGHISAVEQPDLVAAAILGFLGDKT
ncbi:3-oxoadipate enol-lactonase [Hoeflea sp. YIM 152468]|uniref:3-oxoadipate enol-lactonase n=1 Tax=Hoeflea sp. YIM 152468 TaxID=3031759 RepID=UPI0023D980EB|nr:3-oxoadipate enol-lactonase [Hoeflea sp. YIM 152468]MDF1610244.1 3-oxoadipate enol-lactonase [Hoeflea sp. YIM 152468]